MASNQGSSTQGHAIHWARLYDLGTSLLSFGRCSAFYRKIVELAALMPGERILEVGCGPGRLAIAAAAAADPTAEICGIDPAPEMIELARRNAARAGARAGFEIGTIEALPYPADRFDVVLSSMMLHHLPDDLKRHGLVEMRRVLKPGGRIVAVDFGAAPHGGIGHMLCVLRLRTGSDHIELLRSMFLAASFDAIEVGWTGSRGLAFIRCRKSTTTYLA